MTRVLLVLLLCSCVQPEETCVLRPNFTEGEAQAELETGAVLLAINSECGASTCVRDKTVTPGDPSKVARGYCALPCDLGCPPGTKCTQIDQERLCLHAP